MLFRGAAAGGVCPGQQPDGRRGGADPGPVHPQGEEGGPPLEGGPHRTYPLSNVNTCVVNILNTSILHTTCFKCFTISEQSIEV